jgi:deazaflavin-dependent oxidoreductase (nitroreductase family)
MGFGRVILILTTKGGKTGKKRRTPLEYHRVDGVIHLLSCRGKKADWLRNIQAHPDDVWVQVGFRRFRARIEIIEDFTMIERFLKWYSMNHPNLAGRFYGWDLVHDNPDTANFSSLTEYLVLARVHRWEKS